MKIRVLPSVAEGSVAAPPSKSAAHREMIAAALSDGCVIENLGESADMTATRRCLTAMGATVEGNRFGGLHPQNCKICEMDAGESGSTLRFLIPLCLMCDREIVIKGQGRLLERPLAEYEEMCKQRGFLFENDGKKLRLKGKLQSGEFRMNGERSSQFITGMMFALPLLEGDSTLIIEGNAQSLSYIHLTEQILREFGICFEKEGNRYRFYGGQKYQRDRIAVEGDWSNAAFLDAFNVLGGKVEVGGLSSHSTQGDKIYREYYQKLGKETLDLSDCPDLAPILFALSALTGGSFVGTKRLRLKESDRIAAMKEELSKCSVVLRDTEDTVTVEGGTLCAPQTAINGHNDHRIVMAMAVLLSRVGGSIEGAQAVAKSFPDFFKVIETLGVRIEYDQ